MLNKKGAVAIEQLPGIVAVVLAIVGILFLFLGCHGKRATQVYNEFEFSKDKIEAAKALNFFLEMPINEPKEGEETVLDFIIRNYLNFLSYDQVREEFDEIAQGYFSEIYGVLGDYGPPWRLKIAPEFGTTNYYESRSQLPDRVKFETSVIVPIPEDTTLKVTLQVFK